jgi:lysophospholipase L1-like esterase
MNNQQVVLLLAGIVCLSGGFAAGIGLAIIKPGKVRDLARRWGRPDYNKQWFYDQTVNFHKRIDACTPDGAVIFIGDSFIQGMCVTGVVSGGINYGIGGDTAAGVLARIPIYKSIPRVRAVVLAVGDNDLRRGYNESVIVANCQKILTGIPTNVPVLFCSLTPCGEQLDGEQINKRITSLNHHLTEVCSERRNCHYIELGSGLANDGGYLRPQFDDGDGVHLNGEGYQLCIEKLRESLMKLAPIVGVTTTAGAV